MRLARKSSSQAATLRFGRRGSLPGAFRIRLWAHVLDGREVGWRVIGSDAALIVEEDHVHDPIRAVPDRPMAADDRVRRRLASKTSEVMQPGLALDLVVLRARTGDLANAVNDDDGFEAGPIVAFLQPVDIVERQRWFPAFDAVMIAIDRLVPADPGVLEVAWPFARRRKLDIVAQRALISFECEDIIGLLVNDLLGDSRAGSRSRRWSRSRPRSPSCRRSLGMATISLDLSATLIWPSTEGAGVPRRPRPCGSGACAAVLLAGPARGLTVNGNHLAAGSPVSGGNPGDEAALEMLGIERGENIAEMIVRRRPVSKRKEPARKIEFLSANRAISTKVSAPASTASRHSSSTSPSGYITLPRWRRSGRSRKCRRELTHFAVPPAARRHLVHRRPPQIDKADYDKFSSRAVCHALPSLYRAVVGIDPRSAMRFWMMQLRWAELDFPPILGSATVAGVCVTGSEGDFCRQGSRFRRFRAQLRHRGFNVPFPKSTKAPDHNVSGMAPPSRMMCAQRLRIAANMSNMAAPIFKNIWRPWRTILPAVRNNRQRTVCTCEGSHPLPSASERKPKYKL